MNTPAAQYAALVAELKVLETAPALVAEYGRLYLTDEGVDRDNVLEGRPAGFEGTPEFWRAMISAARMAAGQRAEGYGFDINAAIGRAIY